jgi:hypothetical protein
MCTVPFYPKNPADIYVYNFFSSSFKEMKIKIINKIKKRAGRLYTLYRFVG